MCISGFRTPPPAGAGDGEAAQDWQGGLWEENCDELLNREVSQNNDTRQWNTGEERGGKVGGKETSERESRGVEETREEEHEERERHIHIHKEKHRKHKSKKQD